MTKLKEQNSPDPTGLETSNQPPADVCGRRKATLLSNLQLIEKSFARQGQKVVSSCSNLADLQFL